MSESGIKICGITSPEDARACGTLGADYLGVIFAAGPRRISPARAAEIRAAVPGARLVGVFADAELATVVRYARIAGLDLIQLHGAESPIYCEAIWSATSLPVIKALDYQGAGKAGGLSAYRGASFFLLDLDKREANPEHAMPRLWSVARRTRRNGYRIFLAGKLAATNVRRAIERTAPFAVDVCRGVESAPGIKDLEKAKRFITEVRECPAAKG